MKTPPHRWHRCRFVAALLLLLASPAPAAPGSPDPTFDGDGMARYTFAPGFDEEQAVAVQGDGKAVVAGTASGGGITAISVTRHAASGALDPTFGDGGIVTVPFGAASRCGDVRIQPDGKIVVAGTMTTTLGNQDFLVVRLNPDGSPDAGFGTGGMVSTPIGPGYDVATGLGIQADGKIVVGGYAYISGTFIPNDDFAAARYTSTGALDPTFGTGGVAVVSFGTGSDRAMGLLIQGDGAIVLGGHAPVSGSTKFAMVRLTPSGALDATFDGDGRVTTSILGISDQGFSVGMEPGTPTTPDKIVMAGSSSNGSQTLLSLARYNLNGTLDTTFDSDGKVATLVGDVTHGHAFFVRSSSSLIRKIVVTGISTGSGESRPYVARYLSNGALDTTFDGDGIAYGVTSGFYGHGQAVVFHSGAYLAVGEGRQDVYRERHLWRFTESGAPDAAFDGDGRMQLNTSFDRAFGRAVLLQPDGKIVVAGGSSTSDFLVARMSADGVLDPTFGTGGATRFTSGFAAGLSRLADGRFVVGGTSGTRPSSKMAVARLTPTGALDPGFSAGSAKLLSVGSGWAECHASLVQPDGRIVLAGECFLNAFGATAFVVVRLNPTGSFDTNFGTNGVVIVPIGDTAGARAIARQADGKIVVAGFSTSAGVSRFAVARFDDFGSLDFAFNASGAVVTPVGTGGAVAYDIEVLPNGRLVAGGECTNGAELDAALVRYSDAGVLDATFGSGGIVNPALGSAGPDGFRALAFETGTLVAAGFASNQGVRSFAVARFADNGALDATYGTAGTSLLTFAGSALNEAWGVAIDAGGRAIVVGEAGKKLGLARLQGGVVSDAGPLGAPPVTAGITRVSPNPFQQSTRVSFRLERDGVPRLRVFGVDGRLVSTLPAIHRPAGEHVVEWDGRDDSGQAVSSGVYYLLLEMDAVTSSRRAILLR